MKNDAATKPETRLITLLMPTDFIPVVDAAVERNDTDRAKYIRAALREKLAREGFPFQMTEKQAA